MVISEQLSCTCLTVVKDTENQTLYDKISSHNQNESEIWEDVTKTETDGQMIITYPKPGIYK
jgi:hypothetical protein